MSATTTDDPPADTPAADLDSEKLEMWRAKTTREIGLTNTVTLHSLDKQDVFDVGQVIDVYEGWDPTADDPFLKPTFALSGWQVGDLRDRLRESAQAAGLDPAAVCPWLSQEAADAPTIVEAPVVAGGVGTTPDDDVVYLAKSFELVVEANRRVTRLKDDWELKHEEASVAKKEWEKAAKELGKLIADRDEALREPNLFNQKADAPPTADVSPAEADRLVELMMLFPLTYEKWEKYGLTEKDVKKLSEGETKHHGVHPLYTYGDISRFVKDPQTGFERRLTDIRGFGEASYNRWLDAELKFQQDWPAIAQAFAAEIGFDLGTPTEPADASPPGAGSGDGGEGGEGETPAGEAATPADTDAPAEQPPERLKPNAKTGELEPVGEAKPKKKRKKAGAK